MEEKRPTENSEPWHVSYVEDYQKARSDEERRQMLLHFGVDPAHRGEAKRLFPVTSDYQVLINNIQLLSKQKSETVNISFLESDVGKNFIYNLNQGSAPSIEKLSKLADYFNVSVDYLLGRTAPADDLTGLGEVERQIVENYRAMNAEGQERLFSTSDDLVQSGKYKKHDEDRVVREA